MPIILMLLIIGATIFLIMRNSQNNKNDVVINTASTQEQVDAVARETEPSILGLPDKFIESKFSRPIPIVIDNINFINDETIFNAKQDGIQSSRVRLIL